MTRILELRHGNARLRLAPALGGRVTSCTLEDGSGAPVDIFHPFPEDHADLVHWARGGLYPLIPYWGRIAQASLHEGANVHLLEPHPDALPHTLHGSAQRGAWTLAAHAADTATLQLAHEPDAHWPWHYLAELRLRLEARALHVDLSLTNTDSRAMPAGIGLHPYLRRPPALQLQFGARNCWPPTEDYLASSPTAIDVRDDFGQAKPFGDSGRTQFYGGWNGLARIISGAGTRWRFGLQRASTIWSCISPKARPTSALSP